MAKFFTEEELEELRRADAELDEEYSLTQEDIEFSRAMDREAKLDRLDNCGRRKAARSAAYYEANKEKIAAQRRRRRKEKKKAASDGANIESGKGMKPTSIIFEIGGNVNEKV